MRLESDMKAIGFFVGKFAVFLGPFGEEMPQLLNLIGAPRLALGLRFLGQGLDAHGLTIFQVNLRVENNDAILDVSDIRRRRG